MLDQGYVLTLGACERVEVCVCVLERCSFGRVMTVFPRLGETDRSDRVHTCVSLHQNRPQTDVEGLRVADKHATCHDIHFKDSRQIVVQRESRGDESSGLDNHVT